MYKKFPIYFALFYFIGCTSNVNVEDIARNARTIYRVSDSTTLIALLAIEKKKNKEEAKKLQIKLKTKSKQTSFLY
jgi:hypothetical protein